jgi:hypothetical protein
VSLPHPVTLLIHTAPRSSSVDRLFIHAACSAHRLGAHGVDVHSIAELKWLYLELLVRRPHIRRVLSVPCALVNRSIHEPGPTWNPRVRVLVRPIVSLMSLVLPFLDSSAVTRWAVRSRPLQNRRDADGTL